MTLSFNTYTHGPKSGGAPKRLVVLLHGLGANGQDLLSLAPYWEHALPDTLFAAPDAPFPCDMAPVGFQWFSLQDWSDAAMRRGVEEAAPLLQAYLDQLLDAHNLGDKDLALVGFSQGTMMSLYTGPRRAHKIAGILGYSGRLIGAEGLAGAVIQKPPIHLIHGEADPIVPVSAYAQAFEKLQENGFDVTGHTTPGLPHGIDQEGIENGLTFLRRILG